jgi:hypothetical protein
MHVNSMPNVIKQCKVYMYADDTCIIYSDTDQIKIQQAMQEDFNNIVRWAHDNGIIINVSKTKCMAILSPYNKCKKISVKLKGHTYDCLHNNNMDNKCSCAYLEIVSSYKYLGLTIETNFNWNCHVNTVCNKLRSIYSKLNSLKYVVSRGVMYVLYYALADTVISYGLGAYGLTFPSNLNKIKILQTRLLKLLVNYKVKMSVEKNYEKLFKLCKILSVEMKVKYNIMIEQFNNDQYKREREYRRPTRQSKIPKLVVPKVVNYYGRRERRYLTPTIVNQLPHNMLRNIKSINVLKTTLKKHFLSICP